VVSLLAAEGEFKTGVAGLVEYFRANDADEG